jgi:hypothetical protein
MTGVAATSLSYAGGSIGIKEARAGRIDHALALQVRFASHWSIFSYPAQRSDGWDPLTSTNSIPEGTRFRLDPTLDVNSLGLHPVAAMVARAAQQYGFIVADTAGAVAVVGESGEGTKARTGTNPWDSLLNGTPDYRMMAGFPWDKLQALPFNYGKP